MATNKVHGIIYDGVTGVRYMSNTSATMCDLLCEGEVDGLVHNEYKVDPGQTVGTIGFDKGITVKEYYPNSITSGQLSSIFWNKTPIFDKDSHKFNFSVMDTTWSQSSVSSQGIPSRRITNINEKLRGLENKDGSPTPVRYPKYYTLRNKHCSKVIVNLKIGALGHVDRNLGTLEEPNEGFGQMMDDYVTVNISWRAKYSRGSIAQGSEGGWASDGRNHKVEGTLSSPYAYSAEINLDLQGARDETRMGDFIGWEFRIYKSRGESTTPDVKNDIYVESIVEEINDTFIYPKSFVVKNSFDAENFSKIPDRAYDMRLLKIKVPANYDPVSKTYKEPWNGLFSNESNEAYGWVNGDVVGGAGSRSKGYYWSDNPAWCFYDLITNKRYGLGKYVDTSTFDKWTLYEIGKYCDEIVDGMDGKKEPRFTCNTIIQTREDAFQVLNDMASVFRGIVYYNAGNLYAVQDSLKEPVFQFNNTNVEGGEFNYASTSAKVRHTVAIVRYNDVENDHEPAVEYVEDVDAIRKYGIKEKSISAFGCSSQSKAQRLGRWILSTESNETETVNFTAGQEGGLLRPGDIFTISDTNRLLTRRGGRVMGLNRTSDSIFEITLDSKLQGGKYWNGGNNRFESKATLDGKREYQLTLSTPSYFYDTSQVNIGNSTESVHIRNRHVQNFTISTNTINYDNGDGRSVITVSGNLDQTHFTTSGFSGDALWGIASTGVNNKADTMFERMSQEQEYRVINVGEKENGKYEIAAAEYARQKFGEIDQAVKVTNEINFDIPNSPGAMGTISQRALDPVEAPHTKVVEFGWGKSQRGGNDDPSVSYYQVYFKKSSSTYPTTANYDFSLKIYAVNNPKTAFVPMSNGQYRFRVYAYNSLGDTNGSHGSAQGLVDVVGVAPIKDLKVTHLSLVDDPLGGSTSWDSDPTTPESAGDPNYHEDEYDGSTTIFKWKTTIPKFEGATIGINFNYRVRVIADWNPNGTVLYETSQYKPDDADLGRSLFNWNISDRFESMKTASDPRPYDKIYRKFTLQVKAHDDDGNLGSDSHSDYLYVNNPEIDSSSSTFQGFIDLNNHLKIFNLNRPASAKYAYVLSSKDPFDYADYVNGQAGIDIDKISADVNVLEIDPTYKTDIDDNLAYQAYYLVAYVDQFDLDIEALAKANGDTYDLSKQLAGRVSNGGVAKGMEKVTQDTMDLIGEGWKAWLKIDVTGTWRGRGIACVQDHDSITDGSTDAANYKGYVPFYCTAQSPIIMMPIGTLTEVKVGHTQVGGTGQLNNTLNFAMGCQYVVKDSTWPNWTEPPHQGQHVNLQGAGGGTFDGNPLLRLGFKRYRVYFTKPKGVDTTNSDYWVVGMNCKHDDYYSHATLDGMRALPQAENVGNTWGRDLIAFAKVAYDEAEDALTNPAHKIQIGGSDAYFNFHPAGFVQGFGGLAKTACYFDIHMGHLIDKTYLEQAIFFVMATSNNTAQPPVNAKCNDKLSLGCRD